MAPDGVVWMGGNSGVTRYDPRQADDGRAAFRHLTVKDGLAPGAVTSIEPGPGGVLWIGTTTGITRYTLSAGSLGQPNMLTFTNASGLNWGGLAGLRVAPDGAVWFATDGGVSRYDPRSFAHFTQADGLREVEVEELCPNPNGGIWIAASSSTEAVSKWAQGRPIETGMLTRFDGTNFVNFPEQGHLGAWLGGLQLSRDGALWVGGHPGGLWRFDGNGFESFVGRPGFPQGAQRISLAPDGSLWVAGWDGDLGHIDPVTRKSLEPGVNSRAGLEAAGAEFAAWKGIRAIHCDAHGTVWAGQVGVRFGVFRYKGRSFQKVPASEDTTGGGVWDIETGPGNTIWFATGAGLLTCPREGPLML